MSQKRDLKQLDELIEQYRELTRDYPASTEIAKALANLEQRRAEHAARIGTR